MERRAQERLPSKLKARLVHGNLFYTGSVSDLSEKGIFIRAKTIFNVNSVFVLVLLINNRALNVLGKVKRSVRPHDHKKNIKSGMGIELINPPVRYLDYVRKCRLTGNSVN